jgi:ribonuclease P protein component
MLPHQFRLPSHEVAIVLRDGKKVYTQHLLLRYKPTSNGCARFTCVVSAKREKRAVDRNRVKRLLREAIFQLIKIGVVPCDCVLIATGKLSEMTIVEVTPLVMEIFKRAGVLKG